MSTHRPIILTALAPRFWGAHLLMVLVVAAATSLGVWQYTISERAKQAQVDDLTHADPVPLAEAMGPNDAFPARYLGRSALLEGSWLPEGTVLVADQELDGRTGFWVATPVQVEGTESAMYVVRGWTESAQDAPPAPSGETTVVGWLQPPQQDHVTDDDPTDEVVGQLDTSVLIEQVDLDLYSGFVVDASAETAWAQEYATTNVGTEGLEPVAAPTPPEPDSSEGLRNLLYAIEWWLFALFGLYIWWRYLKDTLRPREEEPAADDPGPGGHAGAVAEPDAAENGPQDRTVISGS